MMEHSTATSSSTVRPVIIGLDRVSKRYAEGGDVRVSAVDDVSLDVKAGEFVVIGGRSGSGKTTLLNLIAGLAAPSAGTVRLDGVDIWELDDAARCRLRNEAIGFVFQFPSLMPTLTALENVALPSAFRTGRERPDMQGRALDLLRTVGLAERADAYPRQLSAGQQQRVVLARSLINSPRIVLADEPTSNLDERTEADMMRLFLDVHESTDVTIVMVTHALALLSQGTHTIVMSEGHLGTDRSDRERTGA